MEDIPDHLLEQIKKQVAIDAETETFNKKLPEVIEEIHDIFRNYGISRKLTTYDVEFRPQTFGNKFVMNNDISTKEGIFEYNPLLSEIIFDHYYPRPNATEFYHFTKLESAIKILSSQSFRLYNLIKNYYSDEFYTFYTDHNLEGYKTNYAPDGDLYETHIMKRTFSLSLAKKSNLTPTQESYLWQVFSDEAEGVRLEFEVKSYHTDFRDIYYKAPKTSNISLLLNVLDNHFKKIYNRQFALSKISKIGGFYLPNIYDIENESRFLIKQFTDDYDFNFTIHEEEDGVAFIELPFLNKYGEFKLKNIHLGETSDKQ